jgi:peptidyl-prolyl cis-trans isomerase C
MKIRSFIIAFCLLANAAMAAESEDVLVRRGDGVITHAQFDAWISRIPRNERALFLSDKSRLEQLLGQLLTNAQMAADAREVQFEQDQNIKLRMSLSAEAELAQAWTSHKIETESSPDLEVLAYEAYLLDPASFMSKRAVDVTHLLVSTETKSDEEALALATDLRSQLDVDPSMFEELIMAYSDDTASSADMGNYDRVEKGDMVKPFENSAFTLQIGEISEPVKTDYGYHLIRLNKVYKSELQEFDTVKDGLLLQVKKQHENRTKVSYLNHLGSFETELSEESLERMLGRYLGSSDSEGDNATEQQ